VDPLLDKIIAEDGDNADLARHVLGQTAISSAKKAYQIFKELFESPRFKKLIEKGAQPQRLLWASTGTKNPQYSDVKYVEELIGPETVNTVPVETLNAFQDHGTPKARLEHNVGKAAGIMERLSDIGINIDSITQQLEDEGVEKFNTPFDKILKTLEQRLLLQLTGVP
jgi:transaldolase